MKEAKYARKGHVITVIETGERVEVPHAKDMPASVNSAKKVSRKLQEAEGGLGCGILTVIR